MCDVTNRDRTEDRRRTWDNQKNIKGHTTKTDWII
jgi:hypothetical protein